MPAMISLLDATHQDEIFVEVQPPQCPLEPWVLPPVYCDAEEFVSVLTQHDDPVLESRVSNICWVKHFTGAGVVKFEQISQVPVDDLPQPDDLGVLSLTIRHFEGSVRGDRYRAEVTILDLLLHLGNVPLQLVDVEGVVLDHEVHDGLNHLVPNALDLFEVVPPTNVERTLGVPPLH